jgi:hypothetical protein
MSASIVYSKRTGPKISPQNGVPMPAKRKPHIRPNRRIAKDRTLDATVSTRLSLEELSEVRALAAAEGLSVAQWLRHAAIGTASLPPAERRDVLQAAAGAA